MHTRLGQTRDERDLLNQNRRFYDLLWSGASLVQPQRFNTWALVQSLLPESGRRLELWRSPKLTHLRSPKLTQQAGVNRG